MEAPDLKPHLLVAGTGKMGFDCGLYFLRRGWRTTWLSGDPGRRDAFGRRVEREFRRLADADPGADFANAARVVLLDEAGALPGPGPDLFLEAVREQVAHKRSVFDCVAALLPASVPLATTSSSILPGQIHPRCVGAHVFFPLEITGLVEVIVPRDGGERDAAALLGILRGAGLSAIVQGEANAFAVNRLLLPLQAETVRALRGGWPASVVDGASVTPLVPFGQLSLMDAVGLDVIAAAVANYARRLPAGAARDYVELTDTLDALVKSGKCGRKNRDGFLSGSPLPWPAGRPSPAETAALAGAFCDLAANTCAQAIASGDIGAEDLERALVSLFAAASPLADVRRASLDAGARERLARLHGATDRSYFLAGSPSPMTAVAP